MTVMNADWSIRPIGEIVDVLDGRRIPVSGKERAGRAGDVPYFGATGQVGWIDDHLFDEELVLLGEDGVQFFDRSKTKAYRIIGRSWVNNHAHVLRPRPGEIDGRYLTHYLNQIDYRGLANGTTRLKLTQAAMRRISVAAPPIEEQRRIVDILEDHFSRLDAADSYITHAQERSQVVLDATIAAEGQLQRSPRRPVSELLSEPLRHGRSVPTAVGGFPVLRLTAIRNGKIDLSERKFGAWTADDAAPYLVHRGDFLVARGNGSLRLVGRGGLVVHQPDPVAYPDTAIRIRTRPDRIDPTYFAFIWDAREIRAQVERSARTTAGIHKINQADVRSVLVPLPELSVQHHLVAGWTALASARDDLGSELRLAGQRSSALRRALLTAAFAGRLTGHSSDLELAEEAAGA